jgi:hypothetical protein
LLLHLGKSLHNSPTIQGGLLHTQTIKPDFLPLELSKTGQITLQAILDGGFATVMVVLPFFFFIYFR